MELRITRWPSAFTPNLGQGEAVEWSDLLTWFRFPHIVPNKDEREIWAPASFKDGYRKKDNVESIHALGLDFDALPANGLTLLEEEFGEDLAIIHTTWSHGFEKPVAARVLVALSRPVSVSEYESITRYLATTTYNKPEALLLDTQALDGSRGWAWPSIRAEGAPYVFRSITGKPVDVEALLCEARKLDDYKRAEQAKENERRERERQARRGKGGSLDMVERCRRYVATIDPAIEGAKGHDQTWRAAHAIVQRFELDGPEGWDILVEYNQRCQPPWSEKELRHKFEDAKKAKVSAPI